MNKLCVVLSLLGILAVSACGITKKDLGFARQGPDETKVQKNEPLILPPEYNVRPKKTAETNADE